MNALHRELDSQGFTALLVDIAEPRELVVRTVRERGYVAPVALDADGEVTSTYGVHGTPTTFLIGRDGGLVARAIGPRPWTGPEGRALLEALLKEPAPRGR